MAVVDIGERVEDGGLDSDIVGLDCGVVFVSLDAVVGDCVVGFLECRADTVSVTSVKRVEDRDVTVVEAPGDKVEGCPVSAVFAYVEESFWGSREVAAVVGQ